MISANRLAGVLPALLASGLVLSAQESQSEVPPAFQEGPESQAADTSATAEGLRKNIRSLRMDLLLGGDRVREAEQEAVKFYRDRNAFVETRLDTVDSDLIELRAAYDVALERALAANDSGQRTAAVREAQPLRAEISELEAEAEELGMKRARLGELVETIRGREVERERLVAQLESSAVLPGSLGIPSLGIGLAPPAVPREATSPLEDMALMNDLFERDPDAARSLVWDLDPVAYWDIFPLDPPLAPLQEALRFPPLDLNSRP